MRALLMVNLNPIGLVAADLVVLVVLDPTGPTHKYSFGLPRAFRVNSNPLQVMNPSTLGPGKAHWTHFGVGVSVLH